MKHDTFEKYPAGGLDLTQQALLTTWDCLADNRSDEGLPDAVTIDVDFGISIGASGGMYGSIRETLSGHGFVRERARADFMCGIPDEQRASLSGPERGIAAYPPAMRDAGTCTVGASRCLSISVPPPTPTGQRHPSTESSVVRRS